MLPKERAEQIERDATLRAKALSNESLRKEAVAITLARNDAKPGDELAELEIVDRVFTLEMGLRKLTGK